MRAILCAAIGSVVLIASFYAQDVGEKSHPRDPAQAAAQTTPLSSKTDSDDTRELRADLQRLKILLNQMRTNLAFVQTTQTPLKHQFELEAEAWQVIVERMERRVKHLEDHGTQGKSGRARTLLGPKKRMEMSRATGNGPAGVTPGKIAQPLTEGACKGGRQNENRDN
ncbi:MAG TPA: hypothetical protein VEK84_04720 [Terriglobales bacterium]|nr:hypothetical protein [Terriglobales bacterium]